jgi:hypothetical protein
MSCFLLYEWIGPGIQPKPLDNDRCRKDLDNGIRMYSEVETISVRGRNVPSNRTNRFEESIAIVPDF